MTSILDTYGRFAFSVLPCTVDVARQAVADQLGAWGKRVAIDRAALRDVRLIYGSPQGPFHPPAIEIGILLSEIDGYAGRRTLFVSNVADGYASMIAMISKSILGTHLSFSVSRLTLEYPRNAITAWEHARTVRVVYAMRESSAWEFFEKGEPLPFEDLSFYRARQKRERLTPQSISECLSRLGYGSLHRDYWISSSPAHLVCETGFELGAIRPS
jgi:hypothetical protein